MAERLLRSERCSGNYRLIARLTNLIRHSNFPVEVFPWAPCHGLCVLLGHDALYELCVPSGPLRRAWSEAERQMNDVFALPLHACLHVVLSLTMFQESCGPYAALVVFVKRKFCGRTENAGIQNFEPRLIASSPTLQRVRPSPPFMHQHWQCLLPPNVCR